MRGAVNEKKTICLFRPFVKGAKIDVTNLTKNANKKRNSVDGTRYTCLSQAVYGFQTKIMYFFGQMSNFCKKNALNIKEESHASTYSLTDSKVVKCFK